MAFSELHRSIDVSAAVTILVIADIKSIWIGWKRDHVVIVPMKDGRGDGFLIKHAYEFIWTATCKILNQMRLFIF